MKAELLRHNFLCKLLKKKKLIDYHDEVRSNWLAINHPARSGRGMTPKESKNLNIVDAALVLSGSAWEC